MKTVICDICGRKPNELVFGRASLYHYKRTIWNDYNEKLSDRKFDICSDCLKAIEKAIKEGGVSDEKSKG